MRANSRDSVLIEVRVDTQGQSDSLHVYNQALLTAKSGLFSISLLSDANTQTRTLDPTVTSIPVIDIFIPEGFSPNGDGINDYFVIPHAGNLKTAIEVKNRWGNTVYQSNDYKNDWDGKGSGKLLGQELPNGTYFCLIKVIDISTGKIVSNGVKSITLRR